MARSWSVGLFRREGRDDGSTPAGPSCCILNLCLANVLKRIHTIREIRAISRAGKLEGKKLGFVPTMGALHEGHLSLVRAAKAKSDVVAVSIFVNPTQFGPNEDFLRYPRTLEKDCELLEQEGADVVFAPSAQEMYSSEESRSRAITWVTVEGLSERLCGKSRPAHFRGVATIVAKLLNIVEPDLAFFGQKDAAQVAVIKRMVLDLNIPVQIEICPIVREADGLALSSRNAYLSSDERKMALVLHASLQRAQKLFEDGERDATKIAAAGKKAFVWQPAMKLDYFEIVDPETLEPVDAVNKRVLVAVAAFVGNTRLIDNILLEP
jgi:pantoate--beta-alanine ligase